MSVSLSATVSIPGISRFYKANKQGFNKTISIVPTFLKKNTPVLKTGETTGQSEVQYSLLGVKREEGKAILLENIFIYGIDPTLWFSNTTLPAGTMASTQGLSPYCSILNRFRTRVGGGTPISPIRTTTNPQGWLVINSRVQNNQVLTDSGDVVYDPNTVLNTFAGVAPNTLIKDVTTLDQPYIMPIIWHSKQESCVRLEGWLEPYITPWWNDFPGENCNGSGYASPFTCTLSLQSQRAYRYEPGKATTFTMGMRAELEGGQGIIDGELINSKATWGARNDTDTYRFVLEGDGSFYVERSSAFAETYMRVDRKDFIDPLDGTGPSKMNIDFTKVTMYSIEFSWYGAVGANFYVYIPQSHQNAKWIRIASLPASNMYTKPALGSPHMRLFAELFIPMGCSKNQLLCMYGSSVYIDGNFRDTLKYTTVSCERKPILQQQRSFITVELPNYIDYKTTNPPNNAIVYPTTINGVCTVDSQIEVWESLGGGAPDIQTAYYTAETESSLTQGNTAFPFLLQTNIINGGTTTITFSSSLTPQNKLEFMRRAQFTLLTMSTPVSTYNTRGVPGTPTGPAIGTPGFTGAGTPSDFGDIYTYPALITSVTTPSATDPRITLNLNRAIQNPFFAFWTNNQSLITQIRALTGAFPAIRTFPFIPLNSSLYNPAVMQSGRGALCNIQTFVNKNNSFWVTEKGIFSGALSFDGDFLQTLNSFGFISSENLSLLQNQNYFLRPETTAGDGLITVNTSPLQEFQRNSDIYMENDRYSILQPYVNPWSFFPFIRPFRVFSGPIPINAWDFNTIPRSLATDGGMRLYAIFPTSPSFQTKTTYGISLDWSSFTVNSEIRHHEFFIYGRDVKSIAGTDPSLEYIQITFGAKDLLSLEGGLQIANTYNFKLFVYGHNGQFLQMVSRLPISSPDNSWSAPTARLLPLRFGPGTSYSNQDTFFETQATLLATITIPKTQTQAITAFKANPNIKLIFKSIFFRNVAFRPATSPNWWDRNAGLYYGTYFIPTTGSIHPFFFFKNNSDSGTAARLIDSFNPVNGPITYNIQQTDAIDINSIPLPELPVFITRNTTLVTTISTNQFGIVKGLPLGSFSFTRVPGANIYQDTVTSELLNLGNKVRRMTFNVSGNYKFKVDLNAIYGPGKFSLNVFPTGTLQRDYKRFFILARTIKTESFDTWTYSQERRGGFGFISRKLSFFTENPFDDIDAALFMTNTVFHNFKPVYIENRLKQPLPARRYIITSVYAKIMPPPLSGSRFVFFEHFTGESNIRTRNQTVAFDILDNRIGFYREGLSNVLGRTDNFLNKYDNNLKRLLPATASVTHTVLNTNTQWFSATKVPNSLIQTCSTCRSDFTLISGYADPANAGNGRYVIAAHIEDVVNGWKRLSTCTYFNNNHTLQRIWMGQYNYNSTANQTVSANISLWGYKEEIVTDSTINTLSGWFPSEYERILPGLAAINTTFGEQQ